MFDMIAGNEKGAALTTPQRKEDTSKLFQVDERVNLRKRQFKNLLSQMRRRLATTNRTLRNIGGQYYIIDLHPCRAVADIKASANLLAITTCELCDIAAYARDDIDGMKVCSVCAADYNASTKGEQDHEAQKFQS